MDFAFQLDVHGKVLLSGGYAVLFEGNAAVTFATRPAIHFLVNPGNEGVVHIKNPQFKDSEYVIWLESLETEARNNQNPHISAALKVGSEFCRISCGFANGFQVTILSDSEFFSSEGPNCENNKIDTQIGQLTYYGTTVKEAAKTGLGSSSALIVGLIKSLLLSNKVQVDNKVLYFLGAIANNIAQDKIGSGFDIATAVFGSHSFHRIPTKIYEKIVEVFTAHSKDKFEGICNQLISIPENLHVPPGFFLYIVDFKIGFDSRLASKQVLKYFNGNQSFYSEFCEASNAASRKLIEFLNGNSSRNDLKKANLNYRKLIQELSQETTVEIEPKLFSFILDVLLCREESQVVYGICPGAGGYDALCFLTSRSNWNETLLLSMLDINEAEFQSMRFALKAKYDYSLPYALETLDLGRLKNCSVKLVS